MTPSQRARLPSAVVGLYVTLATAAFVWLYFIQRIRELGLYLGLSAIGFPSSFLLGMVDSGYTVPWSIEGYHPAIIFLICMTSNAIPLWLVLRLLLAPRPRRARPSLKGSGA